MTGFLASLAETHGLQLTESVDAAGHSEMMIAIKTHSSQPWAHVSMLGE